jgi:hypothetical protein
MRLPRIAIDIAVCMRVRVHDQLVARCDRYMHLQLALQLHFFYFEKTRHTGLTYATASIFEIMIYR